MTDNAQTPPQFDCIQLTDDSGVTVVRFLDERIADPGRIERLGKELLSLSDDRRSHVVIDFSNVKFVSSLAINKLIILERRIRDQGGGMCLAELEPEVREVFGITRLDEWFKIYGDRQEAVREIKAPPSS